MDLLIVLFDWTLFSSSVRSTLHGVCEKCPIHAHICPHVDVAVFFEFRLSEVSSLGDSQDSGSHLHQ
jgi:hypothetical protein